MAVPGQLWVPPLAQSTPLIFIDESENPEKSEIITFEAFWAKNAKNAKIGVLPTILRVILSYFDFQGIPKSSKSAIFDNFMKFPYKIPLWKVNFES